jgi:cysteine desulfurase
MEPIYLDHNATTPTPPEVVEAMESCYVRGYANPASLHGLGRQARRMLEDARELVAEILGADLSPPRRDRVVFTSGGTEANNLAVLGIALASGPAPGQIVISAGEHQSGIGPAERLLEQGWRLDTLGLSPQGVVRVEQLPALIDTPAAEDPAADHGRPDDLNRGECPPGQGKTRLVSVILGNHETGVLQPVTELAAICNRHGVPMHTDAAQVAGKLPVNFGALGVAAMTVAAHKFGGPLGIGTLVLRDGVPLWPLMFGGHPQAGLRPGTESVALAVGMATALELCRRHQDERARQMQSLRDRFERGLRAGLPAVVVHGAAVPRLPQTSSVAFPGLDGEVLRMALELAGVACSVGAACSSGATELSPTLRAMDLPRDLVAASLRFSLGATTTAAEIDAAVRRIVRVCREIQN